MKITPMTHLPSEQSELIEEALGELYECKEENLTSESQVTAILNEKIKPGIMADLSGHGHVRSEEGRIIMTPSGEALAIHVIRRKRLAERLLKDVLNVSEDQIDPAACQWEHILSQEVTTSICTFLGHPVQSPAGKFIPRGDCCQNETTEVAPVICSLDRLNGAERGKITYLLLKKNPELDRLLSLGLIPGSIIRVIQKYPTFVIEVNESQLAFDPSIAEAIFVHPLTNGG